MGPSGKLGCCLPLRAKYVSKIIAEIMAKSRRILIIIAEIWWQVLAPFSCRQRESEEGNWKNSQLTYQAFEDRR